MQVRIDIGLDFDGIHTFRWEPSEAEGAVEVPRPVLDRWTAEREAFKVAYLRWKHVCEDVEDYLYRAEQRRTGAVAGEPPAYATAPAPAPAKSR